MFLVKEPSYSFSLSAIPPRFIMFRFFVIAAIVIVLGDASNAKINPAVDAIAETRTSTAETHSDYTDLEITIESLHTHVSSDEEDENIVQSQNDIENNIPARIPNGVGAFTENEIHEIEHPAIQVRERKCVSVGGLVCILFILLIALMIKFATPK